MAQGEVLTTRAIVLRLVPYRESDRILHIFTETLGKVSAIARGARSSGKRFAGGLQPFLLMDLELRLKPRSSMVELLSCQPQKPFFHISRDPRTLGRAGYLSELVEVLSQERDAAPAVLQLLIEALELLNQDSIDGGAVLRGFEVRLLDTLGVWPDHRHCAICGFQFAPDSPAAQKSDIDGVLCCDCAEQNISAELRRWLVPAPLQEVAVRQLNQELARAIGIQTQERIRALAPKPLRSIAYLKQLEKSK